MICSDRVPQWRVSSSINCLSAVRHISRIPVYIRSDGQVKYVEQITGANGWAEGWLASRTPPSTVRVRKRSQRPKIDATSLTSTQEPLRVIPKSTVITSPYLAPIYVRSHPGRSFQNGKTTHGRPHRGYFLPRLTLQASAVRRRCCRDFVYLVLVLASYPRPRLLEVLVYLRKRTGSVG